MTTYGSVSDEKANGSEKLPLVKFDKGSHMVNLNPEDVFDPNRPFDETFDDQFWIEVKDLYANGKNKLSHAKSQRIVRLKRMKENLGEDEDLMVHLLVTIHDRYEMYCKNENKYELYPTFAFELSEFASILLTDDVKNTGEEEECAYEQLLEVGDDMKTVLHLAAERNLTQVVEYTVSLHPNLVYVTTLDDEYALNFALINRNDDVASVLVDSMENGRVRDLFEANEMRGAVFKFQDFITDDTMKKTVIAILDCLMNPDWPFIPTNKDDEETGENPYSSFPNTPVRYHFYYSLLDGDDEGRDAHDEQGKINEKFNLKSKSCLQLLADSSVKEDAIKHPAVRLLVRNKWDAYGLKIMRRHFFAYVFFLVVMSLAFFLHTKTTSPLKYPNTVDYIRLFFEVVTLLITLVYILSEFDQIEKERSNYFTDPYNYFDIIGMSLLVLILPFRFAEASRGEWAVSAAAFLMNFLRVFKYFPAFKTLGLYTKTFAKIIMYDISKFAVVFVVVMLAFTGSVFMALKSASNLEEVGGFWDVMLTEVRILTEGRGFAEEYKNYNVFVIIFIMINMFFVLVVFVNILIGQISYRYEEALTNAVIQYDIDKTKLVTRIENSRFLCWNQRVRHYNNGGFVNAESLENELLEDWMALKATSSQSEDKRTAVKSMMNRKIRKIRKSELKNE